MQCPNIHNIAHFKFLNYNYHNNYIWSKFVGIYMSEFDEFPTSIEEYPPLPPADQRSRVPLASARSLILQFSLLIRPRFSTAKTGMLQSPG